MIKTFVLIMIISNRTMTGYGITSVSAEFNDLASCNKVMEVIREDMGKGTYANIVSYGCYPLGDK